MNKQNRIIPSTLALQIYERIETLKYVLENAETISKSFPEGKIHVTPGTSEGTFRYYLRKDNADKSGEYIHKSEEKKIQSLCRKKYYEEVIKNTKNELSLLEKTMKKYEGDSLISSYTSIGEGIRKQIIPIIMDNESFAKIWLSQEYVGLPFDQADKSEHYTDKGERVRSKSEVIIANYLYRHNIPYLYEKPIMLKSGRTVYPDFTILDINERREKYLEHLGKLGDTDYVMKNMQKIIEYKENDIYMGINLFFTYENAVTAVSLKDIEKVVRGMGLVN